MTVASGGATERAVEAAASVIADTQGRDYTVNVARASLVAAHDPSLGLDR